MVDADAPVVPVADLCVLRRQWPLSVVSVMSRGNRGSHSDMSINAGFRENETGVVRIVEQ